MEKQYNLPEATMISWIKRIVMKHKIKVKVPVEKRGLFGVRKTVIESRIIEVDEKTYRNLKKEQRSRLYCIEEMMLYDEIFDEWDDWEELRYATEKNERPAWTVDMTLQEKSAIIDAIEAKLAEYCANS